jgi:hypothetical protein
MTPLTKPVGRYPINGQCCFCDYEGAKETPCLEGPDRVHCVHWWDGPDEVKDERVVKG